ncbi:hypothetical protein PY365_10180 [Roseiarcaceae bacterium H3SJ34-1]|uniref:hypothetical protein n=1 Tax=Terripilifer ovatus TaxID=3032367 RepID=UPI003AB9A472|nr:hypothetical protein [Roseiarcaceae bacterium H3SJ34-1]
MDENKRDDNRPDLQVVTPSLKAAIRNARIEQAEQSSVVAELRGAEFARLEMLRDSLEPVLAQVPEDVDLFDTGIVPGDRPRLFIDMIGYIEMGPDRRLYRFIQDTRHGRVTMAESERVDTMVDACTQYIARRLVEREMALASDTLANPLFAAPAEAQSSVRVRRAAASAAAASVAPADAAAPAGAPVVERSRFKSGFLNTVMFLVEFLGGVALLVLLAGAAYFAWTVVENWWIASQSRLN